MSCCEINEIECTANYIVTKSQPYYDFNPCCVFLIFTSN